MKWRLVVAASAFAAVTGWVVFVSSSRDWPAYETVLHALAAPSCGAARFVGLAPAPVGRPGYYLSHDSDRDGVACEVNRIAD